MTLPVEQAALRHAHQLCQGHRDALLEQLGWLPAADEWIDLRRIRNEFTHDYLETPGERIARLQLAIQAARRLLEILSEIGLNIERRFPDMAG